MIKMNNLLQNVNVYARIRVIIDSGIYVCFICVKSDGDCGWKGDRCMERKTEAWIGLDVGTTGVRAIAYEADGTRICGREAFYPLLTPAADRAEQDPQVIYGAVEQVVREAAEELAVRGYRLEGVALSTVMHSFLPLDERKEPLTYMQTWADSRSADIVRGLRGERSFCQSLYQRTGCPVHACYPFAKLLWLRQHAPELFRRMRYAGSIKDYLFRQLTGEWVIDHSAASTSGLYNARKMDWDEESLHYAGIRRASMPGLVQPTYQCGLQPAAAERLHMMPGTPVVIGATDGVLVNVGIGAVQPGQISTTIGTSGAMRMLVPEPRLDDAMRTWCYYLADDIWVAGGAINNGGMVLRWLRDEVLGYEVRDGEDVYARMTQQASEVPAGSEGLLLLPFLTGERSPWWNSELRGMFFGLSMKHGRPHMIRAAMEGICYSLNSVWKVLQDFGGIRDLRVSGSFTKSPFWLQMLADILEQPLVLPDNSEGAAFGAAALGFLAGGRLSGVADTASLVHPRKVYMPNPDTREVYRSLYDIFQRLYEKLPQEFADIAAFQTKYAAR